jgi:acyl-CoA dehydrogenase
LICQSRLFRIFFIDQTDRGKIIIDAALKVFSRKGYADTRMADIDREAGNDAVKEVDGEKFRCHVCDNAVQFHGGYGCAREYLVERPYRDSRILGIGGGTTEIMKEIIGKVAQL